jgi:hypothetical protein
LTPPAPFDSINADIPTNGSNLSGGRVMQLSLTLYY